MMGLAEQIQGTLAIVEGKGTNISVEFNSVKNQVGLLKAI